MCALNSYKILTDSHMTVTPMKATVLALNIA